MLTNKEIIFIGDSLMRYQYLNFIGFLHTAQWISRPTHIEYEKAWGDDWERYLKISTLRFGGYEICDCYRNPGNPLSREYTEAQLKGNFVPGMKENRHYYDPMYNISIKFFFYTGFPFFMSKMPSHEDFINMDSSSDWWLFQGLSVPTFEFRYDMLDPFLSNQIMPRLPDVLFLNLGTWMESPVLAEINKNPKAFIDIFKKSAKFPIWKTTTAYLVDIDHMESRSRVDEPKTLQAIRDENVLVFDAFQITRPFSADKKNYDDTFHFQPHVYAVLNKHFLSFLTSIFDEIV